MTGYLGRTCLALVFVLALFFLIHDLYNFDIGMHIRAGEYIITSRAVPRADIFSYTAPSSPWVNHQWLAQILLYSIYSLGGVAGLVLLQAAVFLAAFLLLYLAARATALPLIFSAAMVLAVLVSNERFLVRPFIFSTLLACAYLYILEDHRSFGGRKLFLIPAMQLLWSNLHAGFHLGPLLIASYLLAAFLESSPLGRYLGGGEQRRKPADLRNLALVLALSIPASFVNPYGHRAFFEAFNQTGSAVFSRIIAEWRSPFASSSPNAHVIFYYKIYIVAAAASFALNYKRLNVARLTVFLLTLFLSAKYRRFLAEFALLNLPAMACNFTEGVSYLKSFRSLEPAVKRLGKISAAAGAALMGLILLTIYQVATNAYFLRNEAHQRFGLGLSDINYPVKELNFVISNSLDGNIFNSEELGGYIIWRTWPERKVFVDGRNLVYGDRFFSSLLDMFQRPGAWEGLFSKFSVNYALVSVRTGNELLIRQLHDDKRRRLVYLGDIAAVFTKDDGQAPMPAYKQDRGPDSPVRRPGLLGRKTFPIGHLNRGDFFLTVGRLEEAEGEYRAASSEAPRHPRPLAGLGAVYLKRESVDKAVRELSAASRLRPHSAETLNNLGVAFNSVKLWPRAIDNFKVAAASRPDYADAYYNLGNAYLKTERYAEAADSYLEAISRNPYIIGAYLNLGAAYTGLDRYEHALTVYKRAAEIYPDQIDARLNIGSVYLLLGKNAEAIEAFRSVLALSPREVVAHKMIADALSDWGKPDEAAGSYEQALEIEPSNAEALRGIYAALSRLGQPEKATRYYLKALDADPRNHLLNFDLGSVFAGLNLNQKAIHAFKNSSYLNPLGAEARNSIGSLYQGLDMLDRAIAEHREAIKLKPGFAEAHYNLGTAYGKKGMLADAIAELEKAVKSKPGFALAHSNLGAAYFLARKYNLAFQHLTKAEQLGFKVNKELMEKVTRMLRAG